MQKLGELKCCGMCSCEAVLYVQKVKGLENVISEVSCICRFCAG